MSQAEILQSAPSPDGAAPRALLWYRVYCMFLAVVYLLCIIGGTALLVFAADTDTMDNDTAEGIITGLILVIVSIPLLVAFAAGPFLPRKKWAWTWGLILIAIGSSSACCLPICIPLLIHWTKPEIKAFYNV